MIFNEATASDPLLMWKRRKESMLLLGHKIMGSEVLGKVKGLEFAQILAGIVASRIFL